MLQFDQMGWDNVNAYDGFQISLAGLLIVFTGLILIFLFYTYVLPWALAKLEILFPEKEVHTKRAKPAAAQQRKAPPATTPAPASPASQPVSFQTTSQQDQAAVAAVATALHFHHNQN